MDLTTHRQEIEQMGGVITVKGSRVKVYVPSLRIMACDMATQYSAELVEVCCRALLKHIRGV